MSIETNHNPPVAEVREGNVKIAIWQRQGAKGTFYAGGRPQLSYKDADGQWHDDSGSYSEFDLLHLMAAAVKARDIIRQLREPSSSTTESQ